MIIGHLYCFKIETKQIRVEEEIVKQLVKDVALSGKLVLLQCL